MLGEISILEAFGAATRTSSANGSAVDLSSVINTGVKEVAGYLNCGAASGTSPTLSVKFQDSDDGSTGWADINNAVFTQLTAAGSQKITFPVSKRYIRAVATISGTSPSFTFGVFVLGVARIA